MAGCGLLGSLCSLFVGRRFRLMLPCVWGPVLLISPSLSQAVELLASFLTLSHAGICGTCLQLSSTWGRRVCSAAWRGLTRCDLDAEDVLRQSTIQLSWREALEGSWLPMFGTRALPWSLRNHTHLRRNAKSQRSTQNGEQSKVRLFGRPSIQLFCFRIAFAASPPAPASLC